MQREKIAFALGAIPISFPHNIHDNFGPTTYRYISRGRLENWRSLVQLHSRKLNRHGLLKSLFLRSHAPKVLLPNCNVSSSEASSCPYRMDSEHYDYPLSGSLNETSTKRE